MTSDFEQERGCRNGTWDCYGYSCDNCGGHYCDGGKGNTSCYVGKHVPPSDDESQGSEESSEEDEAEDDEESEKKDRE